jgi:phenylpropionate dioxygenase-like ring-hydroxylating dioxygenase large terminal subunit
MNSNPDIRTAYALPQPTYHQELTEVRSGTPMGELLRRYWLPVGLSADAGDLPKPVRALAEDLILFRDQSGRPGLVHSRCTHRGSSLLYGRIDDHGIRCCYHGWAFDVEGRCTDQPCEPQNGLHRDKVRQPWYPVQERYGLIFAYMGPPDKKPLLPRYSALENPAPGEQLFTDDHNIGSGRFEREAVPFNWLQHFENIHDPGHFLWLHYFHSGPQFGSRYGELDKLDFQPWERLVDLKYRMTPRGVTSERVQTLPDGRRLRTAVETVLPAIRGVPNPFGSPGEIDTLGFMLPVDDTHFRVFTVLRGKSDEFFQRIAQMRGNHERKLAVDPDHFQRFPGDWEAQGSQGPITLHSEEHLATSDRGVVTLRRLLRQQLDALKAGKDPLNVAFDAGTELVELEAGQFLSAGSLIPMEQDNE